MCLTFLPVLSVDSLVVETGTATPHLASLVVARQCALRQRHRAEVDVLRARGIGQSQTTTHV